MLKLNPGQIHLWFVYFDEIQEESLLERYRNLLTEEERIQEKRFYFEKDQRRYLITRAMVRTVLSRYAQVEPGQWTFSKNAYGRPEIAQHHATGDLSFNISHTQSLIVLGVTWGCALGVDTENIQLREAPVELASQYFAPDEAAAIYDLPEEIQDQKFYQFWTLKESYVKARGMGLSIPLNEFGFDLEREREIEVRINPELNDSASRWNFWQFRPSADYLVAVCAERTGMEKQEFVMKKFIPLEKEEPMECDMLCESVC